MSFVLNSSVTLAWSYADETTEDVRRFFHQVIETGAVVPGLWRLEVANALTMGVRREGRASRCSPDQKQTADGNVMKQAKAARLIPALDHRLGQRPA